jgi:hypothetical protein
MIRCLIPLHLADGDHVPKSGDVLPFRLRGVTVGDAVVLGVERREDIPPGLDGRVRHDVTFGLDGNDPGLVRLLDSFAMSALGLSVAE